MYDLTPSNRSLSSQSLYTLSLPVHVVYTAGVYRRFTPFSGDFPVPGHVKGWQSSRDGLAGLA